jgi:hypothetical protein
VFRYKEIGGILFTNMEEIVPVLIVRCPIRNPDSATLQSTHAMDKLLGPFVLSWINF